MTNSSWFKVGRLPKDGRITERQLWVIGRSRDTVMLILEPEERVAVELAGYEEWARALTKSQASEIIGVLKGGLVAHRVARSTEVGARAVALSLDRTPTKKWFDTGQGRRSEDG